MFGSNLWHGFSIINMLTFSTWNGVCTLNVMMCSWLEQNWYIIAVCYTRNNSNKHLNCFNWSMWGIWLLLSHCSLSLTSSGNDDLILGMSIQATELERGPVIPLIIIQGKRVEKAYCSHIWDHFKSISFWNNQVKYEAFPIIISN